MEKEQSCLSLNEEENVASDITSRYHQTEKAIFYEDCSSSATADEGDIDTGSVSKITKRKHRKRRTLTGLSRQRRAANDRERKRNIRINQAFVHLKKTLPLPHIDISKIEILRLAVTWIDHLGTLLKDYEQQKDLLNIRQMETSRSDEYINCTGDHTPVKHDCLYHQFPDLKYTLWEECIGLPERLDEDNGGCVHIRSNSRFHVLFS